MQTAVRMSSPIVGLRTKQENIRNSKNPMNHGLGKYVASNSGKASLEIQIRFRFIK